MSKAAEEAGLDKKPKTKKSLNLTKKELARIDAYKQVFSTEEGKAVLWDLMDCSYYLKPLGDASNPYKTAENEGRRSLLIHILSLLYSDRELAEQQLIILQEKQQYQEQFYELDQE